MPKKLLSLLAEEITEQGFGRYFRDAILPSGQRIGDVRSVDLSTGKPIDITISNTKVLPSKVEDDEEADNEEADNEDVVFQDIVKDSEKSIGTKYIYAGNDPENGIDCSAFIQFYYKKHGISVPRTADGQYRDSKKFKNKDDLKVGDLIFFEETYALPKGSASHVGIVYEIHPNGQIDMIHAGGKKVNILKNVLEDRYYKKHFLSFGTFRKGIPPKKVEPSKVEPSKVEPSKVVGGDYNKNDRNYSINGRLSSSELTSVMSDVSGRKEYLSNAAAIQFNKMVVDAKKQAVNITLTDAYRVCGNPGDYDKGLWTQWMAWEAYDFHHGNLAAPPSPRTAEKWNKNGGGYCTSNHGFGNAIDVSGGISWIMKNGEKYGWYHGEAPGERWHFTFCGDGVVNTPRFCARKIKIKKDENPTKSEGNKLPKNIQNLIDKLKTDWGVNITKSHIDKEYEMEGDVRPDAGGVNKVALTQIEKLISDCKKANPTVIFPNTIKHGVSGLVSGYRSYTDQVTNFGNKVKNEGRSIDNVQSSNTLPGFSQHHTGKAFDIFSTETSWWNTNSDVKKWVANNCKKYGFEVTYTKTNKLRIPEPWHLFYK